MHAAFNKDLIPILCVGESLSERESGKTEQVIKAQIQADLQGLTKEQVENLIIAYEPIWAIGTGRTATPEQANETIGFIRFLIDAMYGEDAAENIRILYGGSVKTSTLTRFLRYRTSMAH